MSWTVPRLWPGRTVAVIATGQSLTREQVEQVRDLPCVVVNDAWRLAPWAGVLYAADARWWRANPEALAFAGTKVCAQPNRPQGVEYMRHSGVGGFDPDPLYVRTGGNSGYQAVHVAIHTGAARILLLGFDMHGTHFFGPHRKGLKNTPPSDHAKWAKRFPGLIGHGAEIVNCTPGSAIECFPRMSITEALEHA